MVIEKASFSLLKEENTPHTTLASIRKPFRHNLPIQQPMSTTKSGDDKLKKILIQKYNTHQNVDELAYETNNSNFESAYKTNLENNYTNRTPDRSSI